MADHLDAPGLTSPAMDSRVDITDVYAFQSPSDAGRSVLVLNVNPLAPQLADEFRSDALYEILIDTDGDAVPNRGFRIRFDKKRTDPKGNGMQNAQVTSVTFHGKQPPVEDGHIHGDEKPLVDHARVSFGSTPTVTKGHGGSLFFAGFRSDPFFFDLLGFLNGFQFTGSDFFADKNVFGIALEVPSHMLGRNPNVGVWARTLVPMTMQPGHLTQADQMGRPAINTVFNHGIEKSIFNVTQPSDQRTTQNGDGKTYLQSFTDTLSSFGYNATQALGIAEILLPDILTYDYASSAGFLNGRKLADDVIDIELNLVTNGAVTTDMVGPHTDYLSSFPYLGNPH
jgi:hypothetical protein